MRKEAEVASPKSRDALGLVLLRPRCPFTGNKGLGKSCTLTPFAPYGMGEVRFLSGAFGNKGEIGEKLCTKEKL